MNANAERRYQDYLRNFPRPKEGRHHALLSAANLGIMSGESASKIHDDLKKATANAPMPDKEIASAVAKAAYDHGRGTVYHLPPRTRKPSFDGKSALRRIIEQGRYDDAEDLFEASIIRLNSGVENDSSVLLGTLFAPTDLVFIGGGEEHGIPGKNIRTVTEWIAFFNAGGKSGPYIIVNPLSGKPAPKKSGFGETHRGDGNVVAYRHCLVEFDNLSITDQIRFWSAVKLPVRALIHSGGKSIHAWVDVQQLGNVATTEQWQQNIKIGLYEKMLIPLGVDRSCSNPSRLSRIPGFKRSEPDKWQRILWLSQDGREVMR